jgi:hypothetical protein
MVCVTEWNMSASGTKRTSRLNRKMSANDPKQISSFIHQCSEAALEAETQSENFLGHIAL